MATTAQQALNMALDMSDNTGDTSYDSRAISIINNILPELYPYSTTATDITVGARPTPTFVTDLTDALDLDDSLAKGVLPHAMIVQMLLGDDNEKASYHEQKYLEKLAKLTPLPTEEEDITDEYDFTLDGSFFVEEDE